MTSQEIFQASNVNRMRTLQNELHDLRQQVAELQNELQSLQQHSALALQAALDAVRLPADAQFWIVDGWNVLLGSDSILPSELRKQNLPEKRNYLLQIIRSKRDKLINDAFWVVFDGEKIGGTAEERLRITFTGGKGEHRADKMICDYLRMCQFSGVNHRVVVVTADKDFRGVAESLGAQVIAPHAFS